MISIILVISQLSWTIGPFWRASATNSLSLINMEDPTISSSSMDMGNILQINSAQRNQRLAYTLSCTGMSSSSKMIMELTSKYSSGVISESRTQLRSFSLQRSKNRNVLPFFWRSTVQKVWNISSTTKSCQFSTKIWLKKQKKNTFKGTNSSLCQNATNSTYFSTISCKNGLFGSFKIWLKQE